MRNELHVIPVEAGEMLDGLGPLLGGRVLCIVVLVEREVHMMFPGRMRPETVEAVEDSMIAAMLGGDGD